MSFHSDSLKTASTFSLKLTAKKGCKTGFSTARKIENSIDEKYTYEYTGCGPKRIPKLDTFKMFPKEVRKLLFYVYLNAQMYKKPKDFTTIKLENILVTDL